MNIQPIVEGHGEVAALPVLLRRLRDETWRGRYVDSKDKTKCVTLFDNKELSKSKFEAKGNSTDSVKLIVARVRIVSEANGFRELSDLSVGQVAAPGRTRFQLHRKLHSIRCNLGILRRCQSVQRQR